MGVVQGEKTSLRDFGALDRLKHFFSKHLVHTLSFSIYKSFVPLQ